MSSHVYFDAFSIAPLSPFRRNASPSIVTPEGDKLARLSGLDKRDITYWRIERLSSFVNLDDEHSQALFDLFDQSGIGDLIKLREQDFDTESVQSVSLDGLLEYIQRGRKSEVVDG